MTTKCDRCGVLLEIHEIEAIGMAGCYEYEEASCPKCGNIVYRKRTDGVLNVTVS